MTRLVTYSDIEQAHERFQKHRRDFRENSIVQRTRLLLNERLGNFVGGAVVLVDETGQKIGAYKIRGAVNAILALNPDMSVCASAGNHAQGIALGSATFKKKGVIFMPVGVAPIKQQRTREFGGDNIEIRIEGASFDECKVAAIEYARIHGGAFIDPFDNHLVQAGQGTIAFEMMNHNSALGRRVADELRHLLLPVGGGGLGAGNIAWLQHYYPSSDRRAGIGIHGVEQIGSDSMHASLQQKGRVAIEVVDKFADGAAVGIPGSSTYEIFSRNGVPILRVSKNRLALSVHELLMKDGITVETAGALSVSGLGQIIGKIRNQMTACILSGRNIDATKQEEVKIRAQLYYSRHRRYSWPMGTNDLDPKNAVVNLLEGVHDDIEYVGEDDTDDHVFSLKTPEDGKGYLLLEAFESNLIKRGIRFEVSYLDIPLGNDERDFRRTFRGPNLVTPVDGGI